ncbi:MAG TPA: hypothetical protein VF941_20140 [Clostridia bacterium]
MSYDDICKVIGNVSIAAVSRLCVIGFKLFMEDEVYKRLFQEIEFICNKLMFIT